MLHPNQTSKLARRAVLTAPVYIATASLLPLPLYAQLQSRPATPSDALGPYYPPESPTTLPANPSGNLLRNAQALGERVNLSGTVSDTHGKPIAAAVVEIWQTDANGRYVHAQDSGSKPRDPHFIGFGRVNTDAQGQYAFQTILPVAYEGRPPHIHFAVWVQGQRKLVTQMYFAGNNKENSFGFGFSRQRDLLTITPKRSAQGWDARFDLALA